MSESDKAPKTVRIELTEAQQQRVADALGVAHAATAEMALELSAEELEQRIAPKLAGN